VGEDWLKRERKKDGGGGGEREGGKKKERKFAPERERAREKRVINTRE